MRTKESVIAIIVIAIFSTFVVMLSYYQIASEYPNRVFERADGQIVSFYSSNNAKLRQRRNKAYVRLNNGNTVMAIIYDQSCKVSDRVIVDIHKSTASVSPDACASQSQNADK